MALSHTDTDITDLKINQFNSLSDFQAAQAQGLIGNDDISIVNDTIQADWAQNDPNADDYIRNKPFISVVTLITWTNS